MSRDVIDLFVREKSRRHTLNENLYLTNFFNLCEGNQMHHNSQANSSYRILYSPELKIMTIHQFDLTTGGISNKDSENFKEFVEVL